MKNEIACVDVFHKTVIKELGCQPITGPCNDELRQKLRRMGLNIKAFSEELQAIIGCGDLRALRVHLDLEEMAEYLFALADGDELLVLDALTDRLYVLFGAALIFDLPLPEAFDEVHRSNMTKEQQPDDPHALRVRSKGPNYVAPDLETVLLKYRAKQKASS